MAASSLSRQQQKELTPSEIQKYWEIFSPLSQGRRYMTGPEAASVLKRSRLHESQLEQVWDLADMDGDGNFDFEEFCVAMRLVFDLVNGELDSVPEILPEWLVPSSKAHLVAASRAISGQSQNLINNPRAPTSASASASTPRSPSSLEEALLPGFEWHMTPSQRNHLEEIYSAHASLHGEVTFGSLKPLYESISVPEAEITRAWDLVNPSGHISIGKDAALTFLHILEQRSRRLRIPSYMPTSLRTSFERGHLGSERWEPTTAVSRDSASGSIRDDTSTARKARFGDAYLTRLGLSGQGRRDRPERAGYTRYSNPRDLASSKSSSNSSHSNSNSSNSDSSKVGPPPQQGGSYSDSMDQARLKARLAELESRIKIKEEEQGRAARREGEDDQDSASRILVKLELQELLEHKEQELQRITSGDCGSSRPETGSTSTSTSASTSSSLSSSSSLRSLQDDVRAVRDQVEGLRGYLCSRREVLGETRAMITELRGGATS